jgi:acetyl esterase/lipase
VKTYVHRNGIIVFVVAALAGALAAQAQPGPAAILLFHGGGWSAGSAEWTFGDARCFPRPSGSASA